MTYSIEILRVAQKQLAQQQRMKGVDTSFAREGDRVLPFRAHGRLGRDVFS